jgi:hypothetical protein
LASISRVWAEVTGDRDARSLANELFCLREWTDGLPIFPPEAGQVERMVESTGLPRDHIVAKLEPLKGLDPVVSPCAAPRAGASDK